MEIDFEIGSEKEETLQGFSSEKMDFGQKVRFFIQELVLSFTILPLPQI